LKYRPEKPAKGRGRIQLAAERVLRLFGGEATTPQVAQWGYALKLHAGGRLAVNDYGSRSARRTSAQVSASIRNLARRLPKPAMGRGRLQRAARRALLAHGGTATTVEVAQWAYVRKVVRGERLDDDDRRHVRRALDQIAERVGRAGGMGRPIIWRLRQD